MKSIIVKGEHENTCAKHEDTATPEYIRKINDDSFNYFNPFAGFCLFQILLDLIPIKS